MLFEYLVIFENGIKNKIKKQREIEDVVNSCIRAAFYFNVLDCIMQKGKNKISNKMIKNSLLSVPKDDC